MLGIIAGTGGDQRAHFGSLPHFFALTSYIAAMPETFVRRKVTKNGEMHENHAPLAACTSKHGQSHSVRAVEKRGASWRAPSHALYQVAERGTHLGELGAVSDCMPISNTDDQMRISPK